MELGELWKTESVSSLPYQPRDVLPLSLSSADVHVVGLARGLSGYVVPSRLYGIMAVGRPVIVAADRSSETAQLVERVGCGGVLPPRPPQLLAEEIRRARARGPARLALARRVPPAPRLQLPALRPARQRLRARALHRRGGACRRGDRPPRPPPPTHLQHPRGPVGRDGARRPRPGRPADP